MVEELYISDTTDKSKIYQEIIPQIEALIKGETNWIANLANTAAALKQTFNWFWVGFYLIENNELVLAPFQGPIACTRITFGKGVCGKAWMDEETILVPDVSLFEGHIACNANSKSEIVVPLFHNNKIIGVLDCDSEYINHFDSIDKLYLEKICTLLVNNT